MTTRDYFETMLAKDVIIEQLGSCDKDMFITYRHYRVLDEDMIEVNARGGVTFCVAAEPDSKLLHVSMAECSDKDLYNKDIGRKVSFGRLANISEYTTLEWDREVSIAENLADMWDQLGSRYNLDNLELTVKSRYFGD